MAEQANSDHVEVMLIVNPPPDPPPPNSVGVEFQNASFVKVTWIAYGKQCNGIDPDGVIVYYKESSTHLWKKKRRRQSAFQGSIVFDGAFNGSKVYVFRVRILYGRQLSKPSRVIKKTSPGER